MDNPPKTIAEEHESYLENRIRAAEQQLLDAKQLVNRRQIALNNLKQQKLALGSVRKKTFQEQLRELFEGRECSTY